jgi:putative transcriptional regulator
VVTMDNNLFDRLVESMTQMNEILDGERVPSREFVVDPMQVKDIRKATGLTQDKFCKLIDVKLGTLRNWEQGRREPTGPAKALLRAIKNDPEHVLVALAG